MLPTFYRTLRRECLINVRSYAELLNSIWFYIIVITLFPLAITSNQATLNLIAPGLIWVAALLSILLSLDRLFRSDFEDGTLEQMVLSPQPLSIMVLAKITAHWISAVLPLLIITPLFAMILQLKMHLLPALLASLLLGTPTLCLIGAIGVALTLGLRNNGILLSLLMIPVFIPVVIFGSGAVVAVSYYQSCAGQLAILGTLLMISLCLAPWATASALRGSVSA